MSNSNRLTYPVHYLQIQDFDKNGNIINPNIPKDIPISIMIQSTKCGHCIKAKPAYKDFANNTLNKCFCTSILVDGDVSGEKETREGYKYYGR